VKRKTPQGNVLAQGRDEGAREEAVRLVLSADRDAPLAESGQVAGRPCWLKGGPLRAKASVRHSLRRHLLRLPVPRLAEYHNLVWLRKRLFRTPEPICAAALHVRGLVRYQVLATGLVQDGIPLPEALAGASPEERTELVDELADEAARMHALYFVHRDLYPRNVLVTPPKEDGSDGRRLVFLDAWRGGPFQRMRGPAYDLACLMLEGAAIFTPFEQRRIFERYLAGRSRQGRAARGDVLLARSARARERLLAGVDREPGRWRLPQPPDRAWSWRDAVV
jgi:hypothetical protein